MPIDIRTYPRTDFDNFSLTGLSASATLRAKTSGTPIPTVPTSAGTTAVNIIAPYAGTLSGARITFTDALAAHDTNFVTFALVNKGQAGAGTTAMLAATAANTSKITGGSALLAFGKRDLTLHGTAANLVVAAGDVIAVQVIGSGTLANTLTGGYAQLTFDQTA